MTVTEFRVGHVIGRAFSSFFANLTGLLPLLAAATAAFALAGSMAPVDPDASAASGDGRNPIAAMAGAMAANPSSAFASAVASIIGYLWLSAGVSYGVVSWLRGRKAGGVEILLRSLGHVPGLLALAVVVVAFVAILFAFAWFVPVVGPIVFLVVGAYLYATLWVVVPATVAEGRTPIGGVSSSMRLTRGRRWRVLGTIVVWFFISMLGNLVLGAAWMAAGGLGGVPVAVFDGVAQAILLGLGAAVAAVGYHDLRVTREGGAGEAGSGRD